MPRGDKSSYTDKQKRQAEHIEESARKGGRSERSAERIAWATVNKMTGGGKKSGSGRGKRVDKAPARKGGRIGGRRAARPRRTTASRGGRAGRTRSGQRSARKASSRTSRARATRRAPSPRSRSSRSRTVRARA